MGAVTGIPSTRVGDLYIRQRLSRQVQSDQLDLFRIQTQLSSGRRFQMPSEDPDAALRVMSLQRLLERKATMKTNLGTSGSYMTATDTAMGSISNSLNEARSVALGVIGTTSSDTQRAAAAVEIQQIVQRLQDVGNQNFRGRNIFAGTGVGTTPFETTEAGMVIYNGDENRYQSYGDLDLLFDTSVNGNEVFSSISNTVSGSEDISPSLTFNTRLDDLHLGRGVSRGSIAVSDGTDTVIIDISGAETVGNVAALLRENPPSGKTMNVEVTPTGFWIELDGNPGDVLTIQEVGGATTAEELGILNREGTIVPFHGTDVDPQLTLTTDIDLILGANARGVARTQGSDNDIIFEAPTAGTAFNGIKIAFVDDGSVIAPGTDEVATFDGVDTITVTIKAGVTEARHVVDAVNTAFGLGQVPLEARLDSLDLKSDGRGYIFDTPLAAVTDYGSGTNLDKNAGLQIGNDTTTHTIDFLNVDTVEDMLNTMNISDAGLLAEINETATGINIRSRVSGAAFTISENGGDTASQLGVRTFTTDTLLEDLNYGRDFGAQAGTDFTVTLADGTVLPVDVSAAEDINDVIALMDGLAGGKLEARLATYGNGIELVDSSNGNAAISVAIAGSSSAAVSLGLVPRGQAVSGPPTGENAAAVTVASAAAKSDLIFTSKTVGTTANGTTVVFNNVGGPPVSYDAGTETLTFEINPGVTKASDIVATLVGSAFAGMFEATYDQNDNPPNDGSGVVTAGTSAAMSGGTDLLTGSDVNPLETEGLFTALLRLKTGLETNDMGEIERATQMLDTQAIGVSFVRAEVAAHHLAIEALEIRLEDEHIDLTEALSLDLDIDFVEAVSSFSGRQVALEASLRTTAQIYGMTLLNYL
jgi:flagellin-like hook-associated protein FlgL